MDSIIDELNQAIEQNRTVALLANCSVEYSGRAESFLPDGDRLIIIKSDKTLLVHQPKGSAPINYMKENSSYHIAKNEHGFLIESQNLILKEFMRIQVNRVHSISSHILEDDQKLQLKGTERDMADMIYGNPTLIEPGFKPLSREEHTKYGFIDVFGYDKDNVLVVIECKRYNGDLHAVTQLRRYVEKIKSLRGLSQVRGILACPKMSSNSRKMLEDWGFEFRSISPPNYLERYDKNQKRLGQF